MKRSLTVILANGEFPQKGGYARKLLEEAGRVVACDGAAKAYHRVTRRWPTVTIGDMDSVRGSVGGKVIRIAEQDDNDLAKAIRYCRQQKWTEVVIVGATGKREDHMLGNVFRAMEAGVEVVTDSGRFIPFAKRIELTAEVGREISVFATEAATRMTSTGLKWPLDEVRFDNLYCATLNRLARRKAVIGTTHPAFVFLPAEGRGGEFWYNREKNCRG